MTCLVFDKGLNLIKENLNAIQLATNQFINYSTISSIENVKQLYTYYCVIFYEWLLFTKPLSSSALRSLVCPSTCTSIMITSKVQISHFIHQIVISAYIFSIYHGGYLLYYNLKIWVKMMPIGKHLSQIFGLDIWFLISHIIYTCFKNIKECLG